MHVDHFNSLYTTFLTPGDELYAGHMLARASRLWPDRIALICGQETITFKELYKQASAVSNYLQKTGIIPGNKVLILYENSIHFYRAYHAAWQIGAIVVPINTFMHEKELEHVINDSQPDGIMVSAQLAHKISLSYLKEKIIVDEEQLSTLCSHPDVTYQTHARAPHELSVLLYTSGTTGLPKGVMLSSYNCLYNSIQAMAEFRSQPDDKILCALPLFHSFTQNGCVWSSCLLGSTVIIVPKIERKSLLQGISHKPTIVLGVPQLFGLFCLIRTCDFSAVRFFICGGDALPDKIRNFFELIFGRKLCNGYGLSEASPFISVDLDDTRSETNTIGRPLIGISVEARDENNNSVKQGDIGTLWIKGENIMLGYHNAPQATQAILQNGWLNTGDAVRINSAGKIVICGREKDLIINKGIKIYPQEIENCLMLHQAVQAVAVIGAATDHDGEIPIAYVAARDFVGQDDILGQELIDLCKQHIASYKIPRTYIIVKELPTTSTGKVDKKTIRTWYAQK